MAWARPLIKNSVFRSWRSIIAIAERGSFHFSLLSFFHCDKTKVQLNILVEQSDFFSTEDHQRKFEESAAPSIRVGYVSAAGYEGNISLNFALGQLCVLIMKNQWKNLKNVPLHGIFINPVIMWSPIWLWNVQNSPHNRILLLFAYLLKHVAQAFDLQLPTVQERQVVLWMITIR